MLYNLSHFDGLRPEDISKFATKRFMDLVQNPTRLGERLLPFVQRDDWTEEVGRVSFRPVASAVIAPDSVLPSGPLGTESTQRYSILKGGMKYTLNESELRKLRDIFLPGRRVTPAEIFRARPYQLANALVTGYLDLAEAQRWEVLSKGTYTIPNTSVAVDYGVAGGNKFALTNTDTWDAAATADGLDDIQTWADAMKTDIGAYPRLIVMSTKQLNNLLAQAATRTRLAIAGYAGIGGTVTGSATQAKIEFFRDQLNAYLARREIGPVVTYDRMYNKFDFTGAAQPAATRFLHENRVVVIGPAAVDGGFGFDNGFGYQVDGPVVENNFAPGLYTWMAEQDEPFEVAMKSVFWTLPILTDPRTLMCGTVQ